MDPVSVVKTLKAGLKKLVEGIYRQIRRVYNCGERVISPIVRTKATVGAASIPVRRDSSLGGREKYCVGKDLRAIDGVLRAVDRDFSLTARKSRTVDREFSKIARESKVVGKENSRNVDFNSPVGKDMGVMGRLPGSKGIDRLRR
jgi:hypothetical protein